MALMTAGDSPAPLLWANLDMFTLQLSVPVTVAAADLRLSGAGGDYAPAAFIPDSTNPSWKLHGPLGADRLQLALADTVTDGAGNRLAGAPAGGASGGTGASPLQLRVNVLPGDADRSGAVTLTDQVLTRARFGATVGPSAGLGPRSYTPFGHFNGDGRIDAINLAVARSRVSARLPPPQVLPPPAPKAIPAPAAAATGHPLYEPPRRALAERADVLG